MPPKKGAAAKSSSKSSSKRCSRSSSSKSISSGKPSAAVKPAPTTGAKAGGDATAMCSICEDTKKDGNCEVCAVATCELCWIECGGYGELCTNGNDKKYCEKCCEGRLFTCNYSRGCFLQWFCKACLVECTQCKNMVCQYEHGGDIGMNYCMDCDRDEAGGGDY